MHKAAKKYLKCTYLYTSFARPLTLYRTAVDSERKLPLTQGLRVLSKTLMFVEKAIK